MQTIIDPSALEELRGRLQGDAYAPSEEGYDEGRQALNLNAHQHPALVVMAAGAADVVSAVRFARERGLGVGVLATGYGVASPCDDGILINTSRTRSVRIDPEARTARVRAAYSPEDWERLVQLKDRYDPGNIFRFNRNIPPSSARR